MVLDPAILLQGAPRVLQPTIALNPPVSSAQNALSIAQLAGLVQQQRLQGLRIQEEEEQAQGRRALRDLYAQNPVLDTPEQRGEFQRRVSAVNPEAGFQLANQFRQLDLGGAKIAQEQALTGKALAETDKVRDERLKLALELGTKRTELADKTLAATTPQTYAQDRQFLMHTLGLPARALPEVYDQAAIDGARRRATGEAAYAKQLFEQQQERRIAGNEQQRIGLEERRIGIEEARVRAAANGINYGLGSDLDAALFARNGAQLGPRGTPTEAMVEQARKDVQSGRIAVSGAQGEQAARAALSAKPLEEGVAKQVSDIDTALKQLEDVRRLYKPEYVGPITGRLANIRESTTGGLPAEQVDFNRTIGDLSDTLLRARSGGAITEAEYHRLRRLIPTNNLPKDTFVARLESFDRALRQARASKLNVATTSRGDLATKQGPKSGTIENIDTLVDATFNDPRNQGASRKSREQIRKDIELYMSRQGQR